jgi:hypothetical protein
MLKLCANPTFKVDVELPTTDGPMKFKAICKYKSRDEWRDYVAALTPEAKIESVLADVMVGWENVDTPFSLEALEKLASVHQASMDTLFQRYIAALTTGKLEN